MDDDLQSIFMDDWDEDHRSGIVAVIGKPNVGKSTLINAILGQKIAIVSPKPQTTRKNQLGIYTDADVQIIFVDTPGMHKPKRKMGEYMMTSAGEALKDADIILWIMDVSKPPAKPDKFIAETLNAFPESKTMILALNKSDLIEPNAPQIDEYKALVPHDSALLISAVEGTGIDDLMKTLVEKLPLGPRYYPADQVSDESLRFMTAEIVREKIILNTEEEIPHSVAVEIIEFEETEERAVIEAVIYVERHTQKGIVIGKGGSMIKKIGTEARMELIELLEKKVTLNLRVKVLRNWRSNEQFMKRVGYRMSSND